MNVGENIKRIRKEKGLTQKELGVRLGVSQAAIGQFENTESNLKMETIKKIAEALKVDISNLIEDHISLNFEEGKNGQIDSVRETVTDSAEYIMLNFYRQLNDTGKHEAFKRIGELTLIERYKQDSPEQMPRPIFIYSPSEDTK